jgi:urease accessory protein UreE
LRISQPWKVCHHSDILKSNEEEILAIRRARSRVAISRIRAKAKAEGLDRLTIDQINDIDSFLR